MAATTNTRRVEAPPESEPAAGDGERAFSFAAIPLWLVRVALRNAGRFYVLKDGRPIGIGALSSGDLVAWS